jgi:hypothetical protein
MQKWVKVSVYAGIYYYNWCALLLRIKRCRSMTAVVPVTTVTIAVAAHAALSSAAVPNVLFYTPITLDSSSTGTSSGATLTLIVIASLIVTVIRGWYL